MLSRSSCLLRAPATVGATSLAALLASAPSAKTPVPMAPFANRRDTLPASFVDEYLPDGWVPLAEAWCERVVGPHVREAHRSSVDPRRAAAFASMGVAGRNPLFQKILIAPSYLPSDVDSRVRALVVPPPALLVTGLHVLKLTANTLSLFGGEVPSDASLVSLLPMDRMADVAERWGLSDVVLHNYDAQIDGVEGIGEDGERLELPLRLVPSVVVQLTGAVSLLYGPAVAGDMAIAEVFPKVARPQPSTPPLVFM